MRVSASAVVFVSLAILSDNSDAFTPLHFSSPIRQATAVSALKNLHEFDYLLGEQSQSQSQSQGQKLRSVSRRRINLNDERATVLTSSVTGAGVTEEMLEDKQTEGAYDPYADVGIEQVNPQLTKIQQTQEKPSLTQRMGSQLYSMDFFDLVTTLFIPSILLFVGGRWSYNRVSRRVIDTADTTLDSFASEMMYHDGDFEEMKMCHSEYTKKLLWLGPKKTRSMLKRYLALYSKKRTVSPQAISTLSYVFSLFKLSEEKAAEILVSLCRDMGSEKISSAGKLLFFGSRIMKSPEGKAALLPIKEMIIGTYRDSAVAETLVETSQQAMGEAAYRTSVQGGGKKQKSLTVGWEVLGLDKDTATRIFDGEKEEGFVTDREKMYKGQARRYDKKGFIIDKEGNRVEAPKPGEEVEDEDEDDAPTSNVYECSACGYTLFIAKGREFKFFGDDFKCPECGAAKDQFNPRDIEAE
jgi:rubredoxin